MGVIKILIVLLITLFILTKACEEQNDLQHLQKLTGFQPNSKVRHQKTWQARGDENNEINDDNEDGHNLEKDLQHLQELAGFQPDQKARHQKTWQARGDEDDEINDNNEDGCTNYVQENSFKLSNMASRPRAHVS